MMTSKNLQELFNNYRIEPAQAHIDDNTALAVENIYKQIALYRASHCRPHAPRGGTTAITVFNRIMDLMDRHTVMVITGCGPTTGQILKFDENSYLLYPTSADKSYIAGNPIYGSSPVLVYSAFLEWIYNTLEIPSLQDFIKDGDSLLDIIDEKEDEIEEYIKNIFVGSEIYYYNRPPSYWSKAIYPKRPIYINKGTITKLDNVFSPYNIRVDIDGVNGQDFATSLFRSECEEEVEYDINKMVEKFTGNREDLKKKIDREKIKLTKDEKLYNNLITEEKEILDKIKNKTMIWKDC